MSGRNSKVEAEDNEAALASVCVTRQQIVTRVGKRCKMKSVAFLLVLAVAVSGSSIQKVQKQEPRALVDLLSMLLPILKPDQLVGRVFELLDANDVDMCAIHLWVIGDTDPNDSFLGLLADLRAQDSYQAVIQYLIDGGVDMDMVTDALNTLLSYPHSCTEGGDTVDLNALLMKLDGILDDDYQQQLLDLLAGLIAEGNEDLFQLIADLEGMDSNAYITLAYLVTHPTTVMIIEVFMDQGFQDPNELLQLLSDFLGLGWQFPPP
ncbi:unnamed protein product [Cyprideis torosa]|uniref:Uncharacterized protein n=1 Tax=Cyprideis torosa TaxID=163714 RepID=A0A7R8W710_9CRUS|nr:unnamed protein product [Cyprideis torosa]CAG0881890.1 unnamed protein product [Cyprideis torosa]